METDKYRCLLIEDDPEDQELFIDALHDVSPESGCYAVANGEEALRALMEEDFSPDYIFTDINMPQMDGFEFLKQLRSIARFKNIPVIVYSSDFSEQQIQKSKVFAVTAFYSKTRIKLLREILKKYFSDSTDGKNIL